MREWVLRVRVRNAWARSASAWSYSFFALQAACANEEGKCVMRIEPDRLVKVGDGLVVFLFFAPGEAAVDVRTRVVAAEIDRLVAVGDGVVVDLDPQPVAGPRGKIASRLRLDNPEGSARQVRIGIATCLRERAMNL